MVLELYSGPIVGNDPPPHNMLEKPLDGSPKRATVDERLTDVAKTRSLMRAASENDRDVRTRIRMRGTTAGGCAHQRQGRRNHDTNDANKAAWSHLHMLTYCRRPRWRWAAET